MLVHMAPREVAGLQSLAMAHGGSLTINPTTGLPEAGFLSNLLPTLIGAGLSIASGGALTPLMAAGITGAGYGVATGSLQKGLMAGLGAYGGAGLGSGLSAAGAAEAAVPGAAPVSANAVTSFPTDPSAYAEFAPTESNFGAFGQAKGALASAPTGSSPLFGAATDVTGQPLGFEAAAPAPTTPLATATPAPSSYTPAYGTESARNAFQTQAADATITDNFKQAGRGLTSLVDSQAGRDAFLGNAAKEGVEATGVGGLGGLAKYGAAAMSGPLLTPPKTEPYKSDSEQFKYSYDVNRNPDPQGSYTGAPTGERQWFAPKFTRLYADGGQTKSSEDALRYLTSTDPTGRTNDLTGASRQAYDYLMGNGPGYRPQIQTQSALPAARYLGPSGGISDIPATAPVAPVVPSLPETEVSFDAEPEPDPYTPAPEVDPLPSPDEDFPATPMPPYVAPEINSDDLSIRTDPIVSDIPDNIVDPADIPLITPTTPLELPELPNVPEKTGVVEIEPVDPDTTPELTPKAVEPTPDGGVTVTTPDDGVTVQDDGTTEVILDEIAQQPVVQQPTVEEMPDGGATVTMPETPVVAETPVVETPVMPEAPVVAEAPIVETPAETTRSMQPPVVEAPVVEAPVVEAPVVETPDGGAIVTVPETPVVETPAVTEAPVVPEAPVVEQPTVVDTPDGGAMVTMPENPYVPDAVADTYNPDTMDYVEVGDAGGDFGDSGFEQSDDFGKYGLGVSHFGGGNAGGKFLDDLSYGEMLAANGGLMYPRYATGGISNLGGYSDGGRLLRGPGDGVSDSIPAMIGKKQPARLADGEFVIPARIVSELGNGSTDAGARKLYAMMDRIQAARKKTTGKNRVAVNSRADKMMPV
jgi:hypothetical protein